MRAGGCGGGGMSGASSVGGGGGATNIIPAKTKARKTKVIDEHIMCLRAALFTPTGKDKNVTEGIAPAFMAFNRAGLDLEIKFTAQLSRDELRWAFDECKQNMESRYDASGYGWVILSFAHI
jgi:hypothetical protein